MANVRAFQGLHGTVGQPTVQVIDGSTKFNGVNQHLTKTLVQLVIDELLRFLIG